MRVGQSSAARQSPLFQISLSAPLLLNKSDIRDCDIITSYYEGRNQ
jgi:hypothetical protein